MTQINPLAPSVAGSPAAQRVQSDDKAAQLRRAQRKRSVSGAPNTDTYQPQVESPNELEPVSDQPHHFRPQPQPSRRRRPPRNAPDTDLPTLDVKA